MICGRHHSRSSQWAVTSASFRLDVGTRDLSAKRSAARPTRSWVSEQRGLSTVDLLSIRLSSNWRRPLPTVPALRLLGTAKSQVAVQRMGELWTLNPRVRGSSPWRRTHHNGSDLVLCNFTRSPEGSGGRSSSMSLSMERPYAGRFHRRTTGRQWRAATGGRRRRTAA